MYYFFTKDQECYQQFIKEEKIKVRLFIEGNVTIATAEYSLLEFRSPYVIKVSLNSFLSGYDGQGCYLKMNIGLVGTEQPVDVREVKIRNYKDKIYLG